MGPGTIYPTLHKMEMDGLIVSKRELVEGHVLVGLLQPLVSLMWRSTWAGDLLDGVNVGAVGLMARVAWQLGREAIGDVSTALFALGAVAVLFRFKLNSGWVVLAGAALGLLVTVVR